MGTGRASQTEGTVWLSVWEEGQGGLVAAEEAGVTQAYPGTVSERTPPRLRAPMAFKLIFEGWMGLHRWR